MNLHETFLLECGICFSSAAADPVTMTCRAQHVFCFDCMFQYYRQNACTLNSLCCPSCRHEKGSLIVMKRIRDLSEAQQTTQESAKQEMQFMTGVQTKEYYDALPLLQTRFKNQFKNATNSSIIKVHQMSVFVQNYESLKRLREMPNVTKAAFDAVEWVSAEGRPMSKHQNGRSRANSTYLPRSRFSVDTHAWHGILPANRITSPRIIQTADLRSVLLAEIRQAVESAGSDGSLGDTQRAPAVAAPDVETAAVEDESETREPRTAENAAEDSEEQRALPLPRGAYLYMPPLSQNLDAIDLNIQGDLSSYLTAAAMQLFNSLSRRSGTDEERNENDSETESQIDQDQVEDSD